MAGFTNVRTFYLALPASAKSGSQRWHDRLAAKELDPDNNNLIHSNVAALIQVNMMLIKTFRQDPVLMVDPANWQSSLIQSTFFI
ncbi:hypothetical protein [Absidia glauca]|uniref:Ndc10 domain-containing protein n=1 Tax=Absidia glauca TaxID=4829 RepID=A0A168R6M3_ABSGL|nr:hypothetical protein [Absidia glauca]